MSVLSSEQQRLTPRHQSAKRLRPRQPATVFALLAAGTDLGVTTKAGRIEVDSRTGRLVIAITVLGSAVATLTATVVSVALPPIAQDFQASSAGQQWVVNAYLLTVASLILIGGSLGDRLGRARIFRIGVIWFAAASLGDALAPGIEWLIAFRLLQGIGGGLLTPGSLSASPLVV